VEEQDPRIISKDNSDSFAKRMLEAINAALNGQATKTQQQFEINNRPLPEVSIPELISLRDYLVSVLDFEERGKGRMRPEVKLIDPSERKPELILQTGHLETVNSVAFSPDGRFLVTGGQDNVTKLWEISTGRELPPFRCSANCGGGIAAISSDGRYLAAAEDSLVKLWEIESGREIRTPLRGSWTITAIAFSKDGRWLAYGGMDLASPGNKIHLWDRVSGYIHSFVAHTGPIHSLAIAPDGRYLVSASRDSTIKIWELDGIKGLNSVAADFSVSPKGKRLSLRERLDVGRTGRNIQTLVGHSGTVNSIALSSDGTWLAYVNSDRSIKLWDLRLGVEMRTVAKQSPHTNAVALSPNGRWVATAGSDRLIKLWDINSGREVGSFAAHTGSVTAISFSPDSSLLASGSADRTVILWDVATGNQTKVFDAAHVIPSGVAAFSQNGRWLVSGSTWGNTLHIWEVSTGLERRRLTRLASPIRELALSQDGRWLAATDKDKSIKVWDLTREDEGRALSGQFKGASAIAFSPDNTLLASIGPDHTIILWDPLSGLKLRNIAGDTNSTKEAKFSFGNTIAFSPDGRLLASSGGLDKTIHLWNVATGREVRTLVGDIQPPIRNHIVALGGISSLAFSPDGRLLASAGGDRSVTLWDIAKGKKVTNLGGGAIDVQKIFFDPNGQFVAALSRYLLSNLVNVWDVATGKKLAGLQLPGANILDMAISSDGRRLITGSTDGTRIWDSRTGDLLATLISVRGSKGWLVITPDGLFDGSLAAMDRILWRFGKKTSDIVPVEVFLNEFYYPGLLTEILDNEKPNAPRDISLLDRRQPLVKLKSDQSKSDQSPLKGNTSSRMVDVVIEVEEVLADIDYPTGSGVRDVRLFRNGSLVRAWRGDVLRGNSSKVVLEARIPIVAGENRLTCYAFNRDNIKSADATLILTGPDSLKRRGTAYVLAIGINQYANADFNLQYSVPDAQSFSWGFQQAQSKLDIFQSVEVIPLLNGQATKANILRVLDRLSGKNTSPLSETDHLKSVKPAEPEDAVIVYFSGHGTAQQNRFYLIPHDLRYEGVREDLGKDTAALKTLLAHSLSDVELEQAFEKVDASHLLLIIDACNSGQALESEEKRRGPMNSRGLAQLAYEKGMYILTAAQAYQVAIGTARLGHGYLTFALVEEGLKTAAADLNGDKHVLIREWLDYAVERVPKFQQEGATENKDLVQAQMRKGVGGHTVRDVAQRPRVFYRREVEVNPLLIAKPLSR
jgi:WD40 repeat protein